MKKVNKSIKTKLTALALAAVTACSVGAMAVTPAAALTNNIPSVSSMEQLAVEQIKSEAKEGFEDIKQLVSKLSDEDIAMIKKLVIEAVTACVGAFLPGGKVIAPALKAVAGSAFGDKELTIDEIEENINGLYGRIDRFEKDMQNELKNIISIENFDYSIFTPYNSEIEGIVKAIKTVKKSSNYTTKQKIAIIAAQIDSDIEWKKGNSPFVGFTNVSKKLNNSNLIDGNDMFTTVYNYFKQRSMFSGEAIDKAKPILDGIMKNYMAGYTILLECLTAQLMVNAFENTDGIDPYYLSHISKNTDEILEKINELNKVVIDGSNTVSGKYNNIITMNRKIIVNKGKCNKEYSSMYTMNHNIIRNRKDEGTGIFNEFLTDYPNCLSFGTVKDLGEYAKEKGMTVRELLEANGICTDYVPQNTNLATSMAYSDLGLMSFAKAMIGSVHLHGLYKGINIDEKNPSEKEYRMWNSGCNGYMLASTWEFAEPGNAAVILVN